MSDESDVIQAKLLTTIVFAIFEKALKRLEATGRRSFIAAAKRVREDVKRDVETINLIADFLRYTLRLSSGCPPSLANVGEYNGAALRMQNSRWPIELKEALVGFARSALSSDDWAVCGYCGKLVPRSEVVGEYCSKRCHKGMLNRKDWQRRKSQRHETS